MACAHLLERYQFFAIRDVLGESSRQRFPEPLGEADESVELAVGLTLLSHRVVWKRLHQSPEILAQSRPHLPLTIQTLPGSSEFAWGCEPEVLRAAPQDA